MLEVLAMLLQIISHHLNTKSSILGKAVVFGGNGVLKNVKLAVPLKYLSFLLILKLILN